MLLTATGQGGPSGADPTESVLLVRAGRRLCGLALASTIETMRALPCEAMTGAPRFVRGLSVIRGQAVPVIDLQMLLEGRAPSASAARLVTIRVGTRTAAIAVDQVIGVERLAALEGSALGLVPPLLGPSSGEMIQALGALDAELLLVLRAAHLVTEDVWKAVSEAAPATLPAGEAS